MRPELTNCAEQLLAARRSGSLLRRWPADVAPRDSAEAYAIQDAVLAGLDERTVGWKLGCTSLEMQRKLGSDGPIAGRALANRCYPSGSRIGGLRPDMQTLEAEFAFRMGCDLPAREVPYTMAEVRAAIASVHPAIEQVESRFTEWKGLSIHEIVADNSSHGRVIVGPAVPRWQELDLPSCPIRLLVNGVLVSEGHGRDVLGDPLTALLWLAQHLSSRGLALRAGELVISGTCTGLGFMQGGATACVQLGEGPMVTEVRVSYA